jgi:Nuf2 family
MTGYFSWFPPAHYIEAHAFLQMQHTTRCNIHDQRLTDNRCTLSGDFNVGCETLSARLPQIYPRVNALFRRCAVFWCSSSAPWWTRDVEQLVISPTSTSLRVISFCLLTIQHAISSNTNVTKDIIEPNQTRLVQIMSAVMNYSCYQDEGHADCRESIQAFQQRQDHYNSLLSQQDSIIQKSNDL